MSSDSRTPLNENGGASPSVAPVERPGGSANGGGCARFLVVFAAVWAVHFALVGLELVLVGGEPPTAFAERSYQLAPDLRRVADIDVDSKNITFSFQDGDDNRTFRFPLFARDADNFAFSLRRPPVECTRSRPHSFFQALSLTVGENRCSLDFSIHHYPIGENDETFLPLFHLEIRSQQLAQTYLKFVREASVHVWLANGTLTAGHARFFGALSPALYRHRRMEAFVALHSLNTTFDEFDALRGVACVPKSSAAAAASVSPPSSWWSLAAEFFNAPPTASHPHRLDVEAQFAWRGRWPEGIARFSADERSSRLPSDHCRTVVEINGTNFKLARDDATISTANFSIQNAMELAIMAVLFVGVAKLFDAMPTAWELGLADMNYKHCEYSEEARLWQHEDQRRRRHHNYKRGVGDPPWSLRSERVLDGFVDAERRRVLHFGAFKGVRSSRLVTVVSDVDGDEELTAATSTVINKPTTPTKIVI